MLAPGLRLGYLIAPKALVPKLLQAKQAADLHSPSFSQRVVLKLLRDGFIQRHAPAIRALNKAGRDAMLAALTREMEGLDMHWNEPQGGMFLWVRLPQGMSAGALLPQALQRGAALVPGEPFYALAGDAQTLRLSYVTASGEQIDRGIASLAALIREVSEQRINT